MDIKAGIVVVTEFCTPDSNEYKAYIDYMDRKEATRRKHVNEYSLFKDYLDYVGNPLKASGLFTKELDSLDKNQKIRLKEKFSEAQENGSMMWQTAISFDNSWLKEHGLYDDKLGLINEKKVVAVARKSINAMLKNEGLEDAVWAADLHHNTDNIHIHVATVEVEPKREKRRYIQYEKEVVDGKRKYKTRYNQELGHKEKIPILDAEGNKIVKEEFVGKFKKKSLRICKSEIYNGIEENKDNTIKITNIMRDRILNKADIEALYNDETFREAFIDLYNTLPQNVSKRLWVYNANVMAPYRAQIDDLSRQYIDKYHKEDFTALKADLIRQNAIYTEAYGKENDYAEKKEKELYARLGNAILKEVRNLGENMNREEKEAFKDDDYQVSKGKNDMTMYALGKIYSDNRSCMYDEQKALKRYMQADAAGNKYVWYNLGKLYNNRESQLYNEDKAVSWFEKAAANDNEYAQYNLGKIYTDTNSNNFNVNRGLYMLEKAAKKNNAYAQLRLGLLYYKGEMVERDTAKASEWLKAAEENGLSFAGDVVEHINKNKRKLIKGNVCRYINKNELRLALIYLRRSMKMNAEHYLNMQKYRELEGELTQEVQEQ